MVGWCSMGTFNGPCIYIYIHIYILYIMFYLYVHFKDSFGTEDHVLPPKTMFWRFRAHMRLMQNCVWKNQIWARHLLKTQHPDSSMFHMFHCTGLKDLSKQLAINWCWWHVPFKHVSWLVVSKCWFYIPCVFFIHLLWWNSSIGPSLMVGTDRDALVCAMVKDMGYFPIKEDGHESMKRDLHTHYIKS